MVGEYKKMLDEYIENVYKTKKTTLNESEIKVFRSTQVTLRNIDKNLRYIEIPIGQLSQSRHPFVKTGANPITIKRQTLHAGDVLISARSKLEKVGLILDEYLDLKIPTVAMNGIIIIRSGSEALGSLIQSYLQSPEVQELVNNDPRTIKNGKRVIATEIISELPFPDIIQKDFSIFKEKKELFDSIGFEFSKLHKSINFLSHLQLAKATSADITNADSYNPAEWEKIEDILNSAQKEIESLKEKLGIKVHKIYKRTK